MDLHQLRWALLKMSVIVFAATTWIFSSFVFETRPDQTTSAKETAFSSLVRLPASLPSQLDKEIPGVFVNHPKIQEPIRMDTLTVACWDQAAPVVKAQASRWVRLTGRECQPDRAAVEGISVRNLSNGYTATVFDSKAGSLTTDFIPLETGKNEILIRFDHGAGSTSETQIVLNR